MNNKLTEKKQISIAENLFVVEEAIDRLLEQKEQLREKLYVSLKSQGVRRVDLKVEYSTSLNLLLS